MLIRADPSREAEEKISKQNRFQIARPMPFYDIANSQIGVEFPFSVVAPRCASAQASSCNQRAVIDAQNHVNVLRILRSAISFGKRFSPASVHAAAWGADGRTRRLSQHSDYVTSRMLTDHCPIEPLTYSGHFVFTAMLSAWLECLCFQLVILQYLEEIHPGLLGQYNLRFCRSIGLVYLWFDRLDTQPGYRDLEKAVPVAKTSIGCYVPRMALWLLKNYVT